MLEVLLIVSLAYNDVHAVRASVSRCRETDKKEWMISGKVRMV